VRAWKRYVRAIRRQNDRHWRYRVAAAVKIEQLLRHRARRRRNIVAAVVVPPNRWLFLPADAVHKRCACCYCAQEEIFGPVVAIDDLLWVRAEAVALCQYAPRGLAANMWSENINLGTRRGMRYHAGVVWINSNNLF